jgi:hypothetical protein
MGATNPSKVIPGVTQASSSTTLVAVILGLMVNPDRPSFYAEVGLGGRGFSYSENNQSEKGYASGEGTLGAGVWLPCGRSWRVLPKITGGFGAFSPPGSSSGASPTSTNETYGFVMLGVAGFYSADL